MRLRVLSAAVFTLLFALPVFATDNAKIEHLLDLLNVERMALDASAAVVKSQEGLLTRQLPGDANDPRRKAFLADYEKLADEFTRKLFKETKEARLKLYADTYTDQDIDDLIRFYQSPVGKKAVECAPKLMAQMVALTQSKAATEAKTELMPQLQSLLVKYYPESTKAKKN